MRQTCQLLKISRTVFLYQSQARDASALIMRIREISHTRVHYGYRRIHVLLRREGWTDNHKRVYRLYRAAGLSLRHARPKRNKSARLRQPKMLASAINQIWSMDFVTDQLFDGRRFRALTVVDNYTRESLAITVGQSLKGGNVVSTLTQIASERGYPKTIKTDNGPEFISKELDRWAYENNIEIDFSRPGKPTDNGLCESFNGRFREECLNAHWFLSLEDATNKIEAWRKYYNEIRPHTSLEWKTPVEYARQCSVGQEIMVSQESEIST